MASPGTRILSVLLASAAAAWCVWRFVPGTSIDRGFVRLISRTITQAPIAISGKGSQQSPWVLVETSTTRTVSPADHAIVSLADDPEGIFQSSPPSPLDLAIVLKNIRRLGALSSGVSAVLAWEEPDVIALSALDSSLSSFERIATAAPLSRGPTSSPLPPSFRRASIAPEDAQGNISDLPVVNRIPLPGIILGQDNALSGFTLLENEPEGIPLAARWDDRIVFAFPVIAAVVRQGLSIEDIELVPGSHLKVGGSGPLIPIDRYGRMISPPTKTDSPGVNAAALADSNDPLPVGPHKFALLRDDQSGAEPPTRRFSENVATHLHAMVFPGETSPARIFRRAPSSSELTLIGAISLAIAAASQRPRFSRHRIYAIVALIALALQFTLAITVSFWFVGLPILASTLAALTVSRAFFREPAPEPRGQKPVSPPVNEPKPSAEPKPSDPPVTGKIPSPESEPVVLTKKTPAKKAAAKKTAARKTAKKAAGKKVAAKKAAKKAGRPKKSSPSDS